MSKMPTKAATKAHPTSNKINRRPFVADLLSRRGNALVVPGLGSPCWDIFAAGDSPDYVYSWGGMGLAVPTALGLAIAQPQRRILAITGDGEMMMGVGSLAVVADQAPKNLGILVLDNEAFSETGRQRGLSSTRTDLCAVARGFGISETMLVTEASQMSDLATLMFEKPGPTFAIAKIAITEDPWRLPEKDGPTIARRVQLALGLVTP